MRSPPKETELHAVINDNQFFFQGQTTILQTLRTGNENDNWFWRERTDQNWWHNKAINDIHFPHTFFINSSPINSTKIDSLALYFFLFLTKLRHSVGFPGGSAVKNSPAVQETWVQSLGQEDPLEKEMATHSSILAWEIPWTDGRGGL